MNVLELLRKHVDIIGRSPIEVPDFSRRNKLPILFRDAGFKVGAEIGVQQGQYSKRLCKLIPGLKLYAIDSWKAFPGYREHINQDMFDGFYKEALEVLAPYNCTLIREWSVEAAKQFDDGSLDFVYIDADHDFANVVKDIAAWSPKVRKGGVVSGHDFKLMKNKAARHHVVQAVKGWTNCYRIAPWFVLGRGERIPGEARDHNRSWMWVR